jgi:hypothetical protein
MSAATEFRALLDGHAPLTALVGDRVALNAVPEGAAFPLVVFAVSESPVVGLDSETSVTQCAIEVECWADDPAASSAVADAVKAAMGAAPAARCACIVARAGSFDPELGKDATTLSVEWWAPP